VRPKQDSAHFNTDGQNPANSNEDALLLHRGAVAATVPGDDCLRLNLWTAVINAFHKRLGTVYMHTVEDSPVAAEMIFFPTAARVLSAIDRVVLTHSPTERAWVSQPWALWRRRICQFSECWHA
jgi:hypothetical protein